MMLCHHCSEYVSRPLVTLIKDIDMFVPGVEKTLGRFDHNGE